MSNTCTSSVCVRKKVCEIFRLFKDKVVMYSLTWWGKLGIFTAQSVNDICQVGVRKTGTGNGVAGILIIFKSFSGSIESNCSAGSPLSKITVIGEDGVCVGSVCYQNSLVCVLLFIEDTVRVTSAVKTWKTVSL